MDFRFYDPSDPATVTHRHLPHWGQAGATYFITWRTVDSIPKEKAQHWTRLREDWLRRNGVNRGDPDWRLKVEEMPEELRREFRRFSRALDDEMDSCHGECLLREPGYGRIVAEALHHFDGDRYLLGSFVVMPNHVHVFGWRLGSRGNAGSSDLMEEVDFVGDQPAKKPERPLLASREL